jgi:hypothetical protein
MTDYKPLKSFSFITMSLIGGQGILGVLSLLVAIAILFIPDALNNGGVWLILLGLTESMGGLVFVAATVFFLVWIYRAHQNLTPLKADFIEFTPGWAVGWWFIPFANLVKPFQVVREIWCESDPEVPEGPSFLASSLHSAPTYIGLWWAFWIAMNVSANITSVVANAKASPETIAGFMMFHSILAVAAAGLAVYMIYDITRRQELRIKNVGQTRLSEPPPPPRFDRDQQEIAPADTFNLRET